MFASRRKKAHPVTALQRVLFLSLSFSEAIKLAIKKKSFSHNSMVGVRHLPFRISDGVNKMRCGKCVSILNSSSRLHFSPAPGNAQQLEQTCFSLYTFLSGQTQWSSASELLWALATLLMCGNHGCLSQAPHSAVFS